MFNQRAMIQINQIYTCPAFTNSGKSYYGKDFYSRSYLLYSLHIKLVSEMEKLETNNSNSSIFGHVRPNCKTEADGGACKSDPIYMGTICHTSFCDGRSFILRITVK